ncbi:MAG: hypothetical protein J1F01_00795 [Oscillospiraceae bacterium]|nr:hypothetical protein [Oscillospiraceae bacterium]
MKYRENIFSGGIDALFYIILLIFSAILPIAFALFNDEAAFPISIFINAAILAREYLLLCKEELVSPHFWWERTIGIVAAVTLLVYSLIRLYINVYGGQEVIDYSGIDIAFSCGIFIPCIIAAVEGIIYARENYLRTVIKKFPESKKYIIPEYKISSRQVSRV